MERQKIIVFGLGENGKKFIKMCHFENDIVAIIDNDIRKWGNKFENIEIRSLDILKEKEYSELLVVLTMNDYKTPVLQMEKMGLHNYILWTLLYQNDYKCKSRGIMDIYLPDEISGQYANREIKNFWMNHLVSNYSGRMTEYISEKGKLLDVGCGCCTTIFNWLCQGYDAYGVDCCEWKKDFFNQKIDDFFYPQEWKERFVFGYGENLPFHDETFETVTCWYVLEHVNDYRKCIREMLRVTAKGGYILINAPDYRNSYEEHYGVEFHKPIIDNKEEFREFLIHNNSDLSIYEELNFIQKSDIYEELNKYEDSGKGKIKIIDWEQEYPVSRVVIRDDKVVYQRKIALIIQKL